MVENNPSAQSIPEKSSWREMTRNMDLSEAAEPARNSDSATVLMSGPALGDMVINTGYLAAFKEAFKQINPSVEIHAVTNAHHQDLLDTPPVEGVHYRVSTDNTDEFAVEKKLAFAPANSLKPLEIDLNQFNNRSASVTTREIGQRRLTYIDALFYHLQTQFPYSEHGSARYAHAVESLLQLPAGSIDVQAAQPRLYLPKDHEHIYSSLVQRFGIDPSQRSLNVIVEASTADKRYPLDGWADAVRQLTELHPELGVNIIYNSAKEKASKEMGFKRWLGLWQNMEGYTRHEIEGVFQQRGVQALLHFVSGSLKELMVFLGSQRAGKDVVLSNDTGLSHVAAAVPNGPKIVTLYKDVDFPAAKWQGSPNQIPVIGPDGTMHSIVPESIVKEADIILKS